MKKNLKKIILIITFVACFWGLFPVCSASAADEGSIEITETATNMADKQPVSGIKLSLYKVADADATSVLGYNITEAFVDSKITVNDIVYTEDLSETADTLDKYVQSKTVAALNTAMTNEKGYLIFSGLSDGIYLIRQTNTDADFTELGYTYKTDAFIVAVPSLDEEGNKVRNVVCQPKGILTVPDETDTELTVSKVWNDDNNKYGKRPDRIKVGLYKDGKLEEEVWLKAGNNWMYSWENLDTESNWSVKEETVPEGYTSVVSSNDNIWTIKNTYSSSNGNNNNSYNNYYSNVKTGDNSKNGFWFGLIGAAVALAGFLIYLDASKKR